MKKTFAVVVLSLALCGCSKKYETKDFVFLGRQDIKTFVVYDKETKVMYLGHTMGGYCPMYNADGTLKLYEEE